MQNNTQPIADFIARERANPPQTQRELLERLAPILRNADFLLPNHEWDYGTCFDTNKFVEALLLRTAQGDYEKPVEDFFPRVYHKCGTAGCAVGIAQLLWGNIDRILPNPTADASPLEPIFNGGCNSAHDQVNHLDVTSTIVANRIDRFLAGEPV